MVGYAGKQLIGSGAVVWDSRKLFAEGKLNEAQMMQRIALSAPRYVWLELCPTMYLLTRQSRTL
jgi:hypothetical protein